MRVCARVRAVVSCIEVLVVCKSNYLYLNLLKSIRMTLDLDKMVY